MVPPMSVLSKSSTYGVRAALYLVAHGGSGYVSIGQISSDLDISFHFLTKIMQKCTQAGLVASYRGPSGGLVLAKPAKEITVLDIALAVEGEGFLKECVLGLDGCGDKRPCPLHKEWAKERKRIRHLFANTTVDRLSNAAVRQSLRLAD